MKFNYYSYTEARHWSCELKGNPSSLDILHTSLLFFQNPFSYHKIRNFTFLRALFVNSDMVNTRGESSGLLNQGTPSLVL